MKQERRRVYMKRARRRKMRKSRFGGVMLAVVALIVLRVVGMYYVSAHQKQLEYLRYPLRYEEEIIENAQRFALEPWHIAAVVRCESSFRTDAVSSVGAIGLMQIMPDTGEWLAGKFSEKSIFTESMLYDAGTNLKYGCWYLSWLMNRYGQDRTLATAAYHAGHGTVDRWLNDPAVSRDGQTLSYIPYDSTRAYVERVLTACEKYQELYDFTASDDAA